MRANPTPDDPSSPAVKYKLSVWLRNGIFPPAFCPHPVNSCVLLQFGLWELFMQQPQDSVVIISGCTFSITPKFMGPTDARDVCVQLIIAEHHWPRYEQQRSAVGSRRAQTTHWNDLKLLFFYTFTDIHKGRDHFFLISIKTDALLLFICIIGSYFWWKN